MAFPCAFAVAFWRRRTTRRLQALGFARVRRTDEGVIKRDATFQFEDYGFVAARAGVRCVGDRSRSGAPGGTSKSSGAPPAATSGGSATSAPTRSSSTSGATTATRGAVGAALLVVAALNAPL